MEEEVQQIPQQQAPKPPKIDDPKAVLAFASDWLAKQAGSLNAAAEKMGVTRQALVYHLNGGKYVTYKMAEKIDAAFGIRSQYLMTGTHPVFKPDAGAVEKGDLFYQAEDLKDKLDISEEEAASLKAALEKANSELTWLREKVALLEELLRIYRAGAKQ